MKQKLFYSKFCSYGMYNKRMRLGNDYMVRVRDGWHLCRFIKTTRKGFNLLDLNTNKCIRIPGHLYSKKWAGKDIPADAVWFTVVVPEWITIGAQVNKEEDAG